MECEECGAQLRTGRVEEFTEDRTEIYYICPNSRCNRYRIEICAKTMQRCKDGFQCLKSWKPDTI